MSEATHQQTDVQNPEIPELGTHFRGNTSGKVVKVVGFIDILNRSNDPTIKLQNVRTKKQQAVSLVGEPFTVSLSHLKSTHSKAEDL